jgi:hypothetical protein
VTADTLANVERPEAERPRPDAPLLPDLVPIEEIWHGSVGERIDRWRERALRAEREVERLRAELLSWGGQP